MGNIILPDTPVYNAIMFYIIIMCIIVLLRPKFMYNHKTKKFKSFGFDENKTLLSLPVVCIFSSILLYFIFIMVQILYKAMASLK